MYFYHPKKHFTLNNLNVFCQFWRTEINWNFHRLVLIPLFSIYRHLSNSVCWLKKQILKLKKKVIKVIGRVNKWGTRWKRLRYNMKNNIHLFVYWFIISLFAGFQTNCEWNRGLPGTPSISWNTGPGSWRRVFENNENRHGKRNESCWIRQCYRQRCAYYLEFVFSPHSHNLTFPSILIERNMTNIQTH